MNATEWALLAVLSLLWGGSFLFVGIAVKELPVFTVVVVRVALAGVILWFVLKAMGFASPRGMTIWVAFFAMGFINNVVPFSLIVWGQTHVASGVASILNATTPIFTVVVAHFLTADERLTPMRMAGVVMGLLGVAVMIGGEAVASLGVDVVAQLAILAAAISYAFAGVFGRRFRKLGVAPLATAFGQVTASSIMLLPVMLFIDRPWTLAVPGVSTILSLLALAVLSTALAYFIYFRILATAGATNLLLVTFLIPVSAIVLGLLFLNESLEPNHIAGMILIGAGLACIDGRAFKFLSRRE